MSFDFDYLEDEYSEPYKLWQERQDPASTSDLLKALTPVVDSAVRTYGGAKPSPNLRTKAKLLTLEALKKYDSKKAKLRTHLMSNLQGLRRASVQESQIISIPERVAIELGRAKSAENELHDRLGRLPSDQEIAEEAGMSLKRLGYIRQAQPGMSEGSLSAIQTDDGLVQMSPAVKDNNDDTWVDFIYHDLQPVDQLILAHTLGLYGRKKLSKQQIASALGLSAGAVSQRAARIQSRLDLKQDMDSPLL
jgi:RNA polymerase primary sigma factor